MKMTWLHMLFGQVFVPADGQAKSAQKLKMTLLFLPLYFYWKNPLKDFIKRTLYRALSELNWELLHRNCIGATYISLLEEASAGRRRATQAPAGRSPRATHSVSPQVSFFYRLADSTLTFFPSLLEFARLQSNELSIANRIEWQDERFPIHEKLCFIARIQVSIVVHPINQSACNKSIKHTPHNPLVLQVVEVLVIHRVRLAAKVHEVCKFHEIYEG